MQLAYYYIKMTGVKLYFQRNEVICLSYIHLFN